MSALINGIKVAQKLSGSHAVLLRQVTRNLAGWNKDFKPAPFPTTQKERDAAAKKYNLLPQEYEPYPDDGMGYGDYPKWNPGYGIEAKDPYYPYDFPEHKRNLHETLHADIDMYGEDRYSQPERPRYSSPVYWGTFLGVMTLCFVIFFALENVKMFRPAAVKQLADDGRAHYSFETK